MNKVIEKEIESILSSREIAFLACKDGTVHDQPSTGKWNKITVPGFNPEKACKGKDAFLFHTHVASSSMPSMLDNESYSTYFKRYPSLKQGCSVGLDGIFCIGRNGKVSTKEFTNEQENRILDEANVKKWHGEEVFCDKIVDGGQPLYACSVQNFGMREKVIGIFKEVSFFGGSAWAGDGQADVSMYSPLPSLQIKCFGSTGKGMQLACMLVNRK